MQHSPGWCDGSHIAPEHPPHTSLLVERRQSDGPNQCMGMIRRPWWSEANGQIWPGCRGYTPTLFRRIFNDHRESGPRFNVSSEGRCFLQYSVPSLYWGVRTHTDHKNSSPNTNDLYIHYIDKSIGTPPSLEQKNALSNLWQQRWEHNSCIKIVFPSLQQFWKCLKWLNPYVQVIGVWWWVSGSRSAFTVTPEVLNWD